MYLLRNIFFYIHLIIIFLFLFWRNMKLTWTIFGLWNLPVWPLRSPPTPLSRLGWWVRCWGPAGSPKTFPRYLRAVFQTVCEEGGALSTEKRSRRGLHSFLEHIELGVDPVPGMERIFLLGVDQYGTVYLLHSLFSVPVDLYSKTRRLFACQGDMPGETPPPSGGTSCRGLRGAPVRASYSLGRSHQSPGGSLPAQLAGNELRAGGEALDGKLRLGVPGVDLLPPRLCWLCPREVIRWGNIRHRDGEPGDITPDDRSGTPLRGGAQLVAVSIYCGLDGGLCGACVHSPFPVRGGGGGWTLSGLIPAPSEALSRGPRSFYAWPWALLHSCTDWSGALARGVIAQRGGGRGAR